jgi:hypothetical protein
MLLDQEQKPMRTESICRCGRKTELQIGTRSFHIGTRKIDLLNLPHFYCSYCKEATIDSKTDVDDALKHAYRNNLDETDWNQFSN